MLLAGADANSLDKGGSTPLTNLMASSVRARMLDSTVIDDVMTIIVLLQQMGAELNLNKCEYSNPLMVATLLKSANLVEYFLACGADPNIKCIYILFKIYKILILFHTSVVSKYKALSSTCL